MLIWFLEALGAGDASSAAALAKITLRAALAAAGSFVLALLLGHRLIGWLERRFRDPIVSPSDRVAELQRAKVWTPTMGGLFIVAGIVGSLLVCGDLANPLVQLALLLTLGLGALGAVDDLAKLRSRRRGISARAKLCGQLAITLFVACLWYRAQSAISHGTDLAIPACGFAVPLGAWAIPLAVLVMVGSSNAVNLTDGLDGLAGGCLIFATLGMGFGAYVAGHSELAAYLRVPHVAGAGELTVLAGGIVGALLGFLWFNCHPAQVFMGDTGSLPLGGLLGLLAVAARQELLLLIVGGVFVAEAVSVIVQVLSFRWRGRRVLLCAPLHHHFQFLGWPENRIVVRFWIAAALCAIVGLASVKLSSSFSNDMAAPNSSPPSLSPLSLRERAGLRRALFEPEPQSRGQSSRVREHLSER